MKSQFWIDWPKLLETYEIILMQDKFIWNSSPKNPLCLQNISANLIISKNPVIKVKNENAYSENISPPMYLLLNERIPHTLTSSSVAQELASECPYLKVSIFFLSEEWY